MGRLGVPCRLDDDSIYFFRGLAEFGGVMEISALPRGGGASGPNRDSQVPTILQSSMHYTADYVCWRLWGSGEVGAGVSGWTLGHFLGLCGAGRGGEKSNRLPFSRISHVIFGYAF